MKVDPIVEEVRAVRHAISAECGHDPERFAERWKKLDEELRKTGKYKFVTGFYSTEPDSADNSNKK